MGFKQYILFCLLLAMYREPLHADNSQLSEASVKQVTLEEIVGSSLSPKEQQFVDLMVQLGQKNTQMLNPQEAFLLGLKNNLSLHSQGLQYDLLEQALKEVSAVFDPVLQLSASYNDNKTFKRNYIGTVKRSGFRIVPDDMNPFEIPKDEDFEEQNGEAIAQSEDNQPKVIEVLFNKVTAGIERGFEIEASKEQTNPNQTKQYSLSISQTLPWGGEMSLSSTNTDHDIYYRKDFHWDRSWTSSFTFNIETALPFSKNFAQGYDKQLSIQLAEVDKNSGFWSVKNTINDLLAQIDSSYWELVLSYEQLLISQENLKLLEQQLQHVELLYQQLMVTQYDIKQIEAEVAGAKVSQRTALTAVMSASMQLKRLINNDIQINEKLFVPYQYQSILQQTFDKQPEREQLLATSYEFNPQIHIQKLSQKGSYIRREYAQQQTRPDVSFQAEISNQQDNSELGYQGLSDSFQAEPDTKFQSYQLAYRYPLFNRAVKSRLKQAELNMGKEQLALIDIENQLELEIDDALLDLDTSAQQMEIAKSIQNLTELALEQLERKRAIGGDYKEVEWLLNQRKLNQAKLQYITALISAQKATTTLLQSQGLLAHQQLQNLDDFDRFRVVELNRNNKLRFFIPLWFEN